MKKQALDNSICRFQTKKGKNKTKMVTMLYEEKNYFLEKKKEF